MNNERAAYQLAASHAAALMPGPSVSCYDPSSPTLIRTYPVHNGHLGNPIDPFASRKVYGSGLETDMEDEPQQSKKEAVKDIKPKMPPNEEDSDGEDFWELSTFEERRAKDRARVEELDRSMKEESERRRNDYLERSRQEDRERIRKEMEPKIEPRKDIKPKMPPNEEDSDEEDFWELCTFEERRAMDKARVEELDRNRKERAQHEAQQRARYLESQEKEKVAEREKARILAERKKSNEEPQVWSQGESADCSPQWPLQTQWPVQPPRPESNATMQAGSASTTRVKLDGEEHSVEMEWNKANGTSIKFPLNAQSQENRIPEGLVLSSR